MKKSEMKNANYTKALEVLGREHTSYFDDPTKRGRSIKLNGICETPAAVAAVEALADKVITTPVCLTRQFRGGEFSPQYDAGSNRRYHFYQVSTKLSEREIDAMIQRYHDANGFDAPLWKRSRVAANGRTYGQEKAILDKLVLEGKLKFDEDELRYYY
jgi:hypothetical protein